jgi:hypothetical protein
MSVREEILVFLVVFPPELDDAVEEFFHRFLQTDPTISPV